MTYQAIIILTFFSLLYGWMSRRGDRENLLLLSSIVSLFWIQPRLPLRYLDFWLPTITLGIIILSWAITAPAEIRQKDKNLKTAALIIAAVLILSLSRYLDLGGIMDFLHPPGIHQVITAGILLSGLLWILIRIEKISPQVRWLALSGILLIFIMLKSPFLSQKASALWRSLAGQSVELAGKNEIQWLGFSYIAFRILHTIRDRQAGRLPGVSLKKYACYVVFFPALSAGPIARLENFVDELRENSHTYRQDLMAGGKRLVVGAFKKFVIADSLAVFALNQKNATLTRSTLGSWTLLYALSLQIFFDFAGYTDIAIGMARLMNIRLPENFNKPYLKPNLTQFWNNWHMTLTNWFRSYFFFPLSRQMRRSRKYSVFVILLITQISTMVLIGLWHGITLSFVIWGMWHGAGLLIQNRWSYITKPLLGGDNIPSSARWILGGLGTFFTFHYVTLGWIWFALPDPAQGWAYLVSLFGAR